MVPHAPTHAAPRRGRRDRPPAGVFLQHGLPLALAGLFLVATAATAPAQEPGESTSRVTGRVVDRGTGSAIPGAVVAVRSLAAPIGDGGELRVLADDDGSFELDSLAPGLHSLRVAMLGYRTLEDTVDVDPGSWLEIGVELTVEALELDPVMVVVRRPISRAMQGFYQRRRHQVGGDFVTREEIDAVDPMKLTDLLRRYPGVNIMPERRWGGSVSYQVVMRGRCRPALFIDGAPVFNTLIDESLEPRDIEGIEIYRGPETPTRFTRSPCGALVVWTRTGERPDTADTSGLSTLSKVLLAGGVLGLFGLISGL